MTIIAVEPTGYREVTGLVERADGTGGVGTVKLPVYPPTPRGKELRALRRGLKMSAPFAGGWLGLTSIEVLYLEQGDCTLSDEDWERAFGVMRLLAEARAKIMSSEGEAMSEKTNQDPYALHAVVLAYGATPEELAASLEAKAAEIRGGHRGWVSEGVSGVLLVREHSDSGGEEALHQRMHMVFATESDSGSPAIAMFRDRELADRFAAGKPLFDEGDGLGVDIGVARVDVAGTWWNSVDHDPTETAR